MVENQMINYKDEYYVCISNAFVKANQDLNLNETKLLRLMISQVVLTDMETMSNNLMRKVIKIDYGKNHKGTC